MGKQAVELFNRLSLKLVVVVKAERKKNVRKKSQREIRKIM